MITELRRRDPVLFWFGALMILLLAIVALLSIGDRRLILGINPWIKPMKFLSSIVIFLWTVGWFMPDTEPKQRLRSVVRWTIGSAMLIEIACIIMQSARGTTSHYNINSAFDIAVFAVMGVTIFVNTVAMAMFLWILRRDTPPSRAGYLWGVRLGVTIFLLASLEGVLLVANGAHTVGAPDGGPGLPFVNWSTRAGDLRVAHFVGMHAMQALPLLGFVLDRAFAPHAGNQRAVSASLARNLIIAVSMLWVAIMGGLLLTALQGRPLLAL